MTPKPSVGFYLALPFLLPNFGDVGVWILKKPIAILDNANSIPILYYTNTELYYTILILTLTLILRLILTLIQIITSTSTSQWVPRFSPELSIRKPTVLRSMTAL